MAKPKAQHKQLKVALVHDYLAEFGGAERVLEALHQMYPAAPVYTAFVDRDRLGTQWQRFADWDIRTTHMTRIPFHRQLFSPLRVFAPKFFQQLDFSDYDVVISSTNAYFAKAVSVGPHTRHLCYCHTPSRSLWGYSTMTNWKKNPIVRIGGELINHYLRVKDVEIARGNVTHFVANSKETRRRIAKFYKLDATVVFPPVVGNALPKLVPTNQRSYYLYVNRLAFSKHPELAVQACTKLNLPLKVVGSGKMLPHLTEIAGPTIEFLGFIPDDQLNQVYSHAQALLYPVEDEDFGMVPVEAMYYGVPVIAHRSGGPLETVVEGKSGLFFDHLTIDGLVAAVQTFAQQTFDPATVAQQAAHFSASEFISGIRALVEQQK